MGVRDAPSGPGSAAGGGLHPHPGAHHLHLLHKVHPPRDGAHPAEAAGPSTSLQLPPSAPSASASASASAAPPSSVGPPPDAAAASDASGAAGALGSPGRGRLVTAGLPGATALPSMPSVTSLPEMLRGGAPRDGLALKAAAADAAPGVEAEPTRTEPGGVPVYVMLPLDAVSRAGRFKYDAAHAPWFRPALQLLQRTGVVGVAVDVW